MEKEEMAVNSNEKAAENYKKVSGDEFVQASCYGVDVSEVSSSSLQTVLNRANEFKAQQNANDNNKGGDDNPPPASSNAETAETENEDDQTSSYIEIDVDEVAKCTHIQRNELVALCSSTSTAVAIPTDLTQLSTFITVNEGFAKTAVSLANRKILPSETRSYFLKRAQEYGYLWLKGEAQLGQEIRKIESKQGNRTDLQNSKRKKADLDNVLTELRSKKEILAEDYKIGYTQARQLARLTDELVKKELKYAIDNNDGLSRTHALSFLSQPPELTEEEKETMETKTAKAKFKVETNYSSVSYEVLKNRVTTEPITYCSLFACVGSCEYYLEKHGFKCVLANEYDEKRAEYFKAMYPDEETKMIVGCFRAHFDELVKEFKERQPQLIIAGIPCQTFCAMRGKDWKDDDRLTLVLDFVRFVRETKPKYIVLENAKEFLSFSLPLSEDLSAHPIAKQLQDALNGRTMGDYLKDELTAPELQYDLNFAIEDACYYGTAQSRVRSILCASKTGTWNFPKPEEFAKPLWEEIGHLPSLEAGEDSGIPYHKAPKLHGDPVKAAEIANVIAHTGTGRKSQDNSPQYQLPGFGFYGAKGARKFWDRPSNTIDGGSGSALCNRTLHPGRLRKDDTYSDARVLTLKEIFLVNGLPENYEVPEKFKEKEAFVREVMGEIFLPRMLERIMLELPLPETSWKTEDDETSEPEQADNSEE